MAIWSAPNSNCTGLLTVEPSLGCTKNTRPPPPEGAEAAGGAVDCCADCDGLSDPPQAAASRDRLSTVSAITRDPGWLVRRSLCMCDSSQTIRDLRFAICDL